MRLGRFAFKQSWELDRSEREVAWYEFLDGKAEDGVASMELGHRLTCKPKTPLSRTGPPSETGICPGVSRLNRPSPESGPCSKGNPQHICAFPPRCKRQCTVASQGQFEAPLCSLVVLPPVMLWHAARELRLCDAPCAVLPAAPCKGAQSEPPWLWRLV
jgi:hypothetical protein